MNIDDILAHAPCTVLMKIMTQRLLGILVAVGVCATACQPSEPSHSAKATALPDSTAQVAKAVSVRDTQAMAVVDTVPAPAKTAAAKATDWTTAAPQDFTQAYLMGKFDPASHPDFTAIGSAYASRGGMYLRKDAYAAFKAMYAAAKADGVTLRIISATRPFHHQKSIWEAKWEGRRQVNGQMLPPNPRDPLHRARLILMYSSMPGTSRHHWGTDIDLNDLNNAYFESGTGLKIYNWLVAHAADYGFCQVYSPMGEARPTGYLEEKWHWSYLPIARQLTEQYAQKLTDADISGFEGAETALEIGMVKNYVQGINPDCH